MTIDSFYEPEFYDIDDDTVYRFNIESIGGVAMQAWVKDVQPDDSIMWAQIVEGSAFTWEFGGEEPIYINGQANLINPITLYQYPDQVLFTRKTPITNETLFIEGEPFDAEMFEYQIDKLTMILQEIDGGKADCRWGQSTPGGSCVGAGISVPLVDQTVDLDDLVTFTVVVSGTSPFTYEWTRNGIVQPLEVTNEYSFVADATIISGTQVSVTVTNACGTDSSTATLTIIGAPGYACDSFRTFMLAAGGTMWQPQTGLTTGFIPAGTFIDPIQGTARLVTGGSQNSQFFVAPGDSWLDNCPDVYTFFTNFNSSLALEDHTQIGVTTEVTMGYLFDPVGIPESSPIRCGSATWREVDAQGDVIFNGGRYTLTAELFTRATDAFTMVCDAIITVGTQLIVPNAVTIPLDRGAVVIVTNVRIGAAGGQTSDGTIWVNGVEVATKTENNYPPLNEPLISDGPTELLPPLIKDQRYQNPFISATGYSGAQLIEMYNAVLRNNDDYTP